MEKIINNATNLKSAPVSAKTTGDEPKVEVKIEAKVEVKPEPKVEVKPEPKVKSLSREDVLNEMLIKEITNLAPKKLKDRGVLKVVDFETSKYELLFKVVGNNGNGFKEFGKVTNFPQIDTTHTAVSDSSMYKKLQKINIPTNGGEVRYFGNLIRWFEGKDLKVNDLQELLKTRPEKKVEPKVAVEAKK